MQVSVHTRATIRAAHSVPSRLNFGFGVVTDSELQAPNLRYFNWMNHLPHGHVKQYISAARDALRRGSHNVVTLTGATWTPDMPD